MRRFQVRKCCAPSESGVSQRLPVSFTRRASGRWKAEIGGVRTAARLRKRARNRAGLERLPPAARGRDRSERQACWRPPDSSQPRPVSPVLPASRDTRPLVQVVALWNSRRSPDTSWWSSSSVMAILSTWLATRMTDASFGSRSSTARATSVAWSRMDYGSRLLCSRRLITRTFCGHWKSVMLTAAAFSVHWSMPVAETRLRPRTGPC